MKMPEKIDQGFFAPCGMDCMVCYKHCASKKPCAGCLPGDAGKPEHCRKCKLKSCVQAKGLTYCYQCREFPCKAIKALERSYQKRYGASLIQNSRQVESEGLTAFMEAQRKKYTCKACGGAISLHDGACSDCQQKG